MCFLSFMELELRWRKIHKNGKKTLSRSYMVTEAIRENKRIVIAVCVCVCMNDMCVFVVLLYMQYACMRTVP